MMQVSRLDMLSEGEYPFFVRSQEVRYKNTYEYDETAIITSGDGVGVGKIFHDRTRTGQGTVLCHGCVMVFKGVGLSACFAVSALFFAPTF